MATQELVIEQSANELTIDTVAVSRGNAVAEIFATQAELLSALRNDGCFAYAQDTDAFFFRAHNQWEQGGGVGVKNYDTAAALLATDAAEGSIAYALDTATFYFRKADEWLEFTIYGEITMAGNVGFGQQVYRSKTGATLQFRSFTAGSSKLSVTQNDLDLAFDVVPANIQHQSLAGAGTNTHAEIDTALDDVADHINDVTIHRSIDDAGSSNTDLWSAAHIQSELDLKRSNATQIDHNDLLHIGVNTHDEIDAGLADSAAHISDTTVHHVIDDAATDTGTLWSSEKTSNELALKLDTATDIDHNDLLNIGTNTHAQIDSHIANAAIHRSINDAGVSATDLLSASKINTLVSAKADDSAVVHLAGSEVISGAKTFSQTVSGSVDGSAAKLQTARNINGVAFDGTANVTVTAAAGTLTGTTLSSGVTASSLTSVGTLGSLTVTAPIAGAVTGNAATATALQTARAINGVSFDGSAPITVAASAATLTGTTLAAGVTASSLTSVGTLGSLTVTAPITGSVTGASGSTTGNAATATALQTSRNINGVAFDGTANVVVPAAASTLTGTSLASNVVSSSLTSVGTLATLAVTAPIAGSVTGASGSTSGNAATATALQSARTINGVSFDGTGNITVPAAANTLTGNTLAPGVTASSLTSVGTLANLTVTNPISGSVTGNAATVSTNANLTGQVTSVGNATTVTNAAVIGKILSGYTSGAGTVSSSDTLLSAIQKLSGNIAAKADDAGVVHSTGTETISGAKAFADPVDVGPTNASNVAALSCGDPGTGLYGVTGGSLFGFCVQANGLVEMKAASGFGTDKVVQFFGDMAMADGGYGVTQLILRASSTAPSAPVQGGMYFDTNTNTVQYWDGSAWQAGGGGGGSVDAGDLTGATLAAGVTASSLTSLGVLDAININGAAASYLGSTTGNFTAFLDCAATAQAVDFVFRKAGSNAFEFVYDTRDGNGYPWVGPSGAGLAFIGYGDRLTLGISAFDYSKYGWIVDLDAQQMSTGCQMRLWNQSTDPTPMGAGSEYFNTTLAKKRTYNGSTWETLSSKRQIFVNVDHTLTADESGALCAVDGASAGQTFTLPAVSEGLEFEFTMNANTATLTVITAGEPIYGAQFPTGPTTIQAETISDNTLEFTLKLVAMPTYWAAIAVVGTWASL